MIFHPLFVKAFLLHNSIVLLNGFSPLLLPAICNNADSALCCDKTNYKTSATLDEVVQLENTLNINLHKALC